MIGFEVLVNGERLYTAGIAGNSLLVAGVQWGGRNTEDMVQLRTGGTNFPEMKHHQWPWRELGVGDEVTIRVVEVDTPDKPIRNPGWTD